MKHLFTRPAHHITLTYLVFASCWIVFSDQLVFWLFQDTQVLHRAQTIKGWLFIAVTGALLYGLMRRALINIERIALEDSLCQIPNRVAFVSELKNRCADQPESLFSVTLLDVDHFTDINDSLGHSEGDRLINELAAGFVSELKQAGWYVARLGGDEFGLISPSGKSVQTLVKTLDQLQCTIPKKTHMRRLTLSAGSSFYPQHGDTSKDLMRNADMALTSAKQQGRNRHLLFRDQLRERLITRLSLLNDLRTACAERSFTLVYQPQWSLDHQRWTGAEVLLRWHHRERGWVSPEDFIPLAEREGLIEPITELVFEQALAELAQHPQLCEKLESVSINLSHRVLTNKAVMNRLYSTAMAHDSNHPQIIMEITETAAMESLHETLSAMENWKARGMTFSIDDFGTGYSSLARLKQLPLAELKIDRSFIEDLPADQNDAVIAQTILAMAKTLSLSVVAEGVETQEQARFLQHHGCNVLQGFWLARPVPITELAAVLEEQIVL